MERHSNLKISKPSKDSNLKNDTSSISYESEIHHIDLKDSSIIPTITVPPNSPIGDESTLDNVPLSFSKNKGKNYVNVANYENADNEEN